METPRIDSIRGRWIVVAVAALLAAIRVKAVPRRRRRADGPGWTATAS